MTYLGNARSPALYAPNRRDDLIPDPGTSKVTFTLSQEVPGGYEGNVSVIRRKFLYNEIVSNNTTISFSSAGQTISANDEIAAAVLSACVPGQNIKVAGSAANNGLHKITNVVYTPGGTGSICTLHIDPSTPLLANESAGPTITLTQAYDGPWEVLEPEVDYNISGTGPDYNRLITFPVIYQEEDVIYVLHKGDATYSFTPTQNSVGPEQLSENLRNFKYDRFTGNGSQTVYTLSQSSVSAKSLVVYVDGVVLEPNDAFFLTGDYTLDVDGVTLTFAVAPANLSKIRILHLGFSTISRRSAISDGQIGVLGVDAVATFNIQNLAVTESKIASNSISTNKIQANSINGSKILLENGEYLNSKTSINNVAGVIKLNGADDVVVNAKDGSRIEFWVTDIGRIILTATHLYPDVTNTISLGSVTKYWSEIYVNGTSKFGATESNSLLVNTTGHVVGNLTADANIILGGNITMVPSATVDGVDISLLKTQVDQATPPGTIVMTAASSSPTGWIFCEGTVLSQAVFPDLFTAIGSTYNTGGEGVGNFRIPDLRQRFPLGKAASGTGSVLGTYGGSIDHNHTLPTHTHDITHTHTVPGHFHTHNTGIGSSINISSLSGNHNTDIAHTHPATSTPSGEGLHDHNLDAGPSAAFAAINTEGINSSHNHGVGTYAMSTVPLDHQHSVNIVSQNESANHTHSGTTNNDGTHTHTDNDTRASDSGTAPINRIRTTGGSATGEDIAIDSTDSAHSHNFTTGIQNTVHQHLVVGGTGMVFLSHTHTMSGFSAVDGGHQHRIKGRIYNYESNHTHTVPAATLPATNSSSSGAHTHASSAFAGAIGNVTGGIEGNNAMSTISQSTTTSGSGGSGVTGTTNPPFVVINYMIKT